MTCPSCDHDKVREEITTYLFPYCEMGTIDCTMIEVSCPVLTCEECDFMYTDYRGESARMAAVLRYQNTGKQRV